MSQHDAPDARPASVLVSPLALLPDLELAETMGARGFMVRTVEVRQLLNELDAARAELARVTALPNSADVLAAMDAQGLAYCAEHGVTRFRGAGVGPGLPKDYHGCSPCYWQQWYERKTAQLTAGREQRLALASGRGAGSGEGSE